MSRREDKEQIKQLKLHLRTANRTTDHRLLRLALVMMILALIAAYIHDKIHL